MDLLTIALPRPVAEVLVAERLVTAPLPSRDFGETTQMVVSAIGFAADSVSVVVAATALRHVWRTTIAVLRRQPKATKLHVKIGDHADLTLDLDWLAGQHAGSEAIVLKNIGAALVAIADGDD